MLGANSSVSEEAMASSGCLVAAEMHVSLHRKSCRGQDAFGRFHIGVVEPEALGQLQPALDTAFGADIAVVILNCGAAHSTLVARSRNREITIASLIGIVLW